MPEPTAPVTERTKASASAHDSDPVAAAPPPYARPDLYDLLFSGYRADLDFWLTSARNAEGPVLDLCCGTGRILLPLLEAGLDADGVDLYPQMIEQLRRNAAVRGLNPKVYVADMRDFRVPRRYAAVLIPFNAFAHNLTADDQLSTLLRCHHHLEPEGMLAFDVFSATPEMITKPIADPVLELEVVDPVSGRTVQLYDGRALEPARQIQHSKIEVRELASDGSIAASHRFETDVRWVYRSEMELLLRLAGFGRWEIFGGFDRRPYSADSGSLVVTAWRQ